jgi:aldose 1-epimerase
MSATILTWGAALQDVRLEGVPHGLTLGGPNMAAYEGPMGYFGTIVGPVANRIAGARARIAGRDYLFAANDGPNLLHGGRDGTQGRIWHLDGATGTEARLILTLPDGAGGFPGTRSITAAYRLSGASLMLTLTATSDAPTLMNLAHHGYWTLDGGPTTRGQRLTIDAERYLPVDPLLIPTGEERPVHDAFDLRAGRVLDGSEGLDHNFCLARAPRALTEVARLAGHTATMHLATTEPGLQIYDGRRLDTAPYPGHDGTPYGPFAGLAMEPQRWPDAPHQPAFPPITLEPGQTYRQETRWRFTR